MTAVSSAATGTRYRAKTGQIITLWEISRSILSEAVSACVTSQNLRFIIFRVNSSFLVQQTVVATTPYFLYLISKLLPPWRGLRSVSHSFQANWSNRPQSQSFRFLKSYNIHHHPVVTSNAVDIAVEGAFLNK
jgi:hypothetical protein